MSDSGFESRIGKINQSAVKIFDFITDFENIKSIIPSDKLEHFKTDGSSAKLSAAGFNVELIISKKTPHTQVIYSEKTPSNFLFSIEVNLTEVEPNCTNIQIFMHADINPFMRSMISGPVQQALDKLIDKLEEFNFDVEKK